MGESTRIEDSMGKIYQHLVHTKQKNLQEPEWDEGEGLYE